MDDLLMALLPRKCLLAIAAVIDVALNARNRPVSAKALAARHGLPPRHLEPVLQALVRDDILKGVRGPHGGYELAREWRRINLDEIVRAAGSVDEGAEAKLPSSGFVSGVVLPAVAEAERAFSTALAQLTVAELAERAEELGLRHEETTPRREL
jgi:Rrf2 family protein